MNGYLSQWFIAIEKKWHKKGKTPTSWKILESSKNLLIQMLKISTEPE